MAECSIKYRLERFRNEGMKNPRVKLEGLGQGKFYREAI